MQKKIKGAAVNHPIAASGKIRKTLIHLLCLVVAGTLSGCSMIQGDAEKHKVEEGKFEYSSGQVEVQAFIAASLHTVMEELAARFDDKHPDVKILFNADSSGTLQTQIEEGYACDLFFSAAKKQMDDLEDKDFLIENTRKDLLNNYVVLIKRSDSSSQVNGFKSMKDAKSIALAGGSVPVGKYTRQALVTLGILPDAEDVSKITTKEISQALGGVTISEQSNVSKVLIAVKEGACEVGTTYYSDTYGYENDLEVIETAGYDLTGEVTYPIALVKNKEADDEEIKAAREFYNYLMTEEAKKIFENYYFETASGE